MKVLTNNYSNKSLRYEELCFVTSQKLTHETFKVEKSYKIKKDVFHIYP